MALGILRLGISRSAPGARIDARAQASMMVVWSVTSVFGGAGQPEGAIRRVRELSLIRTLTLR
jgi:hypothetical protein